MVGDACRLYAAPRFAWRRGSAATRLVRRIVGPYGLPERPGPKYRPGGAHFPAMEHS